MLRRIAQHSYTLKAYGWVAIWVGLLGAVVSFCPWVLLNFTETPAFTPLSWSPDGSRLALGAREEFHTVGIYVIDANGENLHKVLDQLKDTIGLGGGEISELGWIDNQTIYLISTTGLGTRYYAISADGSHFWPIQAGDIPPSPSPRENETYPPTACDEVDFVETRTMNAAGLLAQSACVEYCGPCTYMYCTLLLQVCDTATGEIVFDLQGREYALARADYSLLARPVPIYCIALAVLGLVMVVTASTISYLRFLYLTHLRK